MQRLNVNAHYVVVNHDPEAVANHELDHLRARAEPTGGQLTLLV